MTVGLFAIATLAAAGVFVRMRRTVIRSRRLAPDLLELNALYEAGL